MYDAELLREQLLAILEALERIPRRFEGIGSPSDFTDSDSGIDRMDSICMTLVAVGEEFKTIDRTTKGHLLAQYPLVNWRGVIGIRDFLAHGYFRVNINQLFAICQNDVPQLIDSVRQMIADLEQERGSTD